MINQEIYKCIPGLHPFIDYVFEDKSKYGIVDIHPLNDLTSWSILNYFGGHKFVKERLLNTKEQVIAFLRTTEKCTILFM